MKNTKSKILNTSLQLFNRHGSLSITTNHIAKACEISTGTLYYHYSNKEQIVLALYEQMIAAWDNEIAKIQNIKLDTLNDIKKISNEVYSKYSFINNDLYALCQIDPELFRINQECLMKRKEQISVMIESLVSAEGYEPLDAKTMLFLVDTIWIYMLFWQPYKELSDPAYIRSSPMENVDFLLSRFLIKNDAHA